MTKEQPKERPKEEHHKEYKFMLHEEDLKARIENNSAQMKNVIESVKTFCSNILVVLEASKVSLQHGKNELEEALRSLSSRGLLEWLIPLHRGADAASPSRPYSQTEPLSELDAFEI